MSETAVATAAKNELYYSDMVKEDVIIGIDASSGTIEHAAASLKQFYDTICEIQKTWEEEGVINIFAKFYFQGEGVKSMYHGLVCQLSGSKPWDKEKIEAFEKEVDAKQIQDDGSIDLMTSLITQNPDAALEILAGVLKGKPTI